MGIRARRRIVATLIWAVALVIAQVPLRSAAQAPHTPPAPLTAGGLVELRLQYLLQPDLAERRLIAIQRASDVRFRSDGALSKERLLEGFESLCVQLTGQEFIRGNALVRETLDSLARTFFWNPESYSDNQLEHLDFVSRRAFGTPFLKGNQSLIRFLGTERTRFFNSPEQFQPERLKELERVSLFATSLPFLRGSPSLVALLERARMEHEDNRDAFTEQRLAELDYISRTVRNEPFARANRWGPVLFTVVLIVALGLTLAVNRRHQKYRRVVAGTARPGASAHAVMTVREACEVLSVDPDCTHAELTRAYRTMQKQYHPDLVAQLGTEIRDAAQRKTQSLNEAYRLLLRRLETGNRA